MIKRSNEIDQHVGRRVRRRRRALGMSQTKLGNALGVAFQQVQKYENGATRISARRLHEISCVLRVSVAFFFEGLPRRAGKHDSAPSCPVSDFATVQDGLALAGAFTRIRDTRLRNLIVLMTEQIAGSGLPDSRSNVVNESEIKPDHNKIV